MNFMWHEIITAVALVLVFEGIMPFLSPTHWRQMISRLTTQSDHIVRIIGLVSMLLGVVLLYLINA